MKISGKIITLEDLYDRRGERVRVIRFEVRGIFSHIDARNFSAEIFSCLDPSHSHPVIVCDDSVDYCIDFQNLNFFGCAGLGELIVFNKKHYLSRRKNVPLVGVDLVVRDIFAISGLRDYFEFYPSLEEYLDERRFL